MTKLASFRLNTKLLSVIRSWLGTRQGFVIVNGKKSNPMLLFNLVFQGTVWGPCLWNLFYEDARIALRVHHFLEIVFADDLNAFRAVPLAAPNASVMAANNACQVELHAWGRANQVEFDQHKQVDACCLASLT